MIKHDNSYSYLLKILRG